MLFAPFSFTVDSYEFTVVPEVLNRQELFGPMMEQGLNATEIIETKVWCEVARTKLHSSQHF